MTDNKENIKITIEIKPDEIIWSSNADIMATVYYLDRVKNLIHKRTNKLDDEKQSKNNN